MNTNDTAILHGKGVSLLATGSFTCTKYKRLRCMYQVDEVDSLKSKTVCPSSPASKQKSINPRERSNRYYLSDELPSSPCTSHHPSRQLPTE